MSEEMCVICQKKKKQTHKVSTCSAAVNVSEAGKLFAFGGKASTCTLEKGSMTRMRFCSSRLSYSLVRWMLMMGSFLSSALYSVSALKSSGKNVVVTNEGSRKHFHSERTRKTRKTQQRGQPVQSLRATGSYWLVPHISGSLSVGRRKGMNQSIRKERSLFTKMNSGKKASPNTSHRIMADSGNVGVLNSSVDIFILWTYLCCLLTYWDFVMDQHKPRATRSWLKYLLVINRKVNTDFFFFNLLNVPQQNILNVYNILISSGVEQSTCVTQMCADYNWSNSTHDKYCTRKSIKTPQSLEYIFLNCSCAYTPTHNNCILPPWWYLKVTKRLSAINRNQNTMTEMLQW